jgi:hypothetical protein
LGHENDGECKTIEYTYDVKYSLDQGQTWTEEYGINSVRYAQLLFSFGNFGLGSKWLVVLSKTLAISNVFDPTKFSPDLDQWVGYIESGVDDARENKLVALGPAPPGLAGRLEGPILLVIIARLSKTPEGLKVLREWGTHYLDNVGAIIKGIAVSSSANVYNCLINQYVAVRIYQRMGLMSAHDAIQTAAWVDHVMGLMITKGYFSDTLTGLTTLVNATSETGAGGEKSVGLASLAKLFSGGK